VPVKVVFETHATSEDNERGVATGWLGGRLSTLGRRQAAELGTRRRDDGLAAVYTSDLARAVETVRIAFAGAGPEVVADARLRECDYGRWNGMPRARLEAERLGRIDLPWPGGESWRSAVDRVAGFLDELAADAPEDDRRVLIVGHVATRLALDFRVGNGPLEALVAAPFRWQPGWEYRLDRQVAHNSDRKGI
jgi:alpha-ribazole phosphatase/probable phosphoglycerate mutase